MGETAIPFRLYLENVKVLEERAFATWGKLVAADAAGLLSPENKAVAQAAFDRFYQIEVDVYNLTKPLVARFSEAAAAQLPEPVHLRFGMQPPAAAQASNGQVAGLGAVPLIAWGIGIAAIVIIALGTYFSTQLLATLQVGWTKLADVYRLHASLRSYEIAATQTQTIYTNCVNQGRDARQCAESARNATPTFRESTPDAAPLPTSTPLWVWGVAGIVAAGAIGGVYWLYKNKTKVFPTHRASELAMPRELSRSIGRAPNRKGSYGLQVE